MYIIISRREYLNAQLLDEMHELRAHVFKEKKHWDVETVHNREIDEYDALNPYYMLIRNQENSKLIGCWRFLETTGPYMLRNTFPSLLHGQAALSDKKTLELSRFIVCATVPSNAKLSELTLQAIREVIKFAKKRDVIRLVTVTTVGMERMLIRLGISLARLGPSLQIGVEKAVALQIFLDDQTHNALHPLKVQP